MSPAFPASRQRRGDLAWAALLVGPLLLGPGCDCGQSAGPAAASATATATAAASALPSSTAQLPATIRGRIEGVQRIEVTIPPAGAELELGRTAFTIDDSKQISLLLGSIGIDQTAIRATPMCEPMIQLRCYDAAGKELAALYALCRGRDVPIVIGASASWGIADKESFLRVLKHAGQ